MKTQIIVKQGNLAHPNSLSICCRLDKWWLPVSLLLQLTEHLLSAGYAVVFLTRRGSKFPFWRRLEPTDPYASLVDLMKPQGHSTWAATASTVAAEAAAATSNGARLLAVPFTTVIEYLALLRVCTRALHEPPSVNLPSSPSVDEETGSSSATSSTEPVGARALVVLAAAVSDFYIPGSVMATDKLQSTSAGASNGLSLQLHNVPKLLRTLALEWCPLATVCTFKLETNEHVLLAKATASLAAYGVSVVAANNLADYKRRVTLVQAEHPVLGQQAGNLNFSGPAPTVLADRIVGDETAPIPIAHVTTKVISVEDSTHESGDSGSHSIEGQLVEALVTIHREAFDASIRKNQIK